MFGNDITELQIDIDRRDGLDEVKVKTYYPHMYSQTRIFKFAILRELDTPFLNGLRTALGMDSAEKHTVIAHCDSISRDLGGASETEDWDSPPSVRDELEDRGYKVITWEEADTRYDKSAIPFRLISKIETRKRQREKRKKLTRERKEAEQDYELVEECNRCEGYYVFDTEKMEQKYGGWIIKPECVLDEKRVRGKPLKAQRHRMGCKGRRRGWD